jgi:hypothetical protein
MQIRIVTAEAARAFAKENPKQQVEPTNGILAFDGEYVSGNVTFVSWLPHFGYSGRILTSIFLGRSPGGSCPSLWLGRFVQFRGP